MSSVTKTTGLLHYGLMSFWYLGSRGTLWLSKTVWIRQLDLSFCSLPLLLLDSQISPRQVSSVDIGCQASKLSISIFHCRLTTLPMCQLRGGDTWNKRSLPPITCMKSWTKMWEFPLNEKFPQKGKCWQMHLFLASWTCPNPDVGMWSGSEGMYVRAGCVMHQVYRSWIVPAGVLWAKFPRWGYEYEWVSPWSPGKSWRCPCRQEGQSVLTAILESAVLVLPA